MAVTVKAIISSKLAASGDVTQYTAPASTRVIIDKMTGTNTSGAAATLIINLVPSGGAVGLSNKIVTKTFGVDECYPFPEVVGHVLNAGDFVNTNDSVNNAITIRASGREVT